MLNRAVLSGPPPDYLDTEDKKLALIHRLCSEQVTYILRLSRQRSDEILKHAYEYTVRENIIDCMDEVELSDAQLTALLAFPSPMDAIYGEYGRRDAPHVEVVRDSIRSCADNALSYGET